MTIDEFLNIDTPENVIFNYEIAGVATRSFAAIIDTAIIAVVQILVGLTILAVTAPPLREWADEAGSIQPWLIALAGLLSFAMLWGYYVAFELRWNGQSPGKRALGLRVVRADGLPITLSESLVRNLVRLVDFLPASYGVGIVVMFANSQTRRLGDLAAGTVVIRDQQAVTLENVTVSPSAPSPWIAAETGGENIPVQRLTDADIQMLEEFLRRSQDITVSDEVGYHILGALLSRMDLPRDWMTNLTLKTRLQTILVAAHRDRH